MKKSSSVGSRRKAMDDQEISFFFLMLQRRAAEVVKAMPKSPPRSSADMDAAENAISALIDMQRLFRERIRECHKENAPPPGEQVLKLMREKEVQDKRESDEFIKELLAEGHVLSEDGCPMKPPKVE